MNTKCRTCASYWHRPGCAKYRKPTPWISPSLKQQRRQRYRAQKRREAIGAGLTDCVIQWAPFCRGTFDGWHHLRKVSQGGDDSEANMVRSCNQCNLQIEDQPTEAERRGWVQKGTDR